MKNFHDQTLETVIANMSAENAEPRVAVLSTRDIYDHVSASGGYTFEDAIAADLDQAIHLSPRQKPLPASAVLKFATRARNWFSRRNVITRNRAPNLTPAPLDRDVDLFFFHPARTGDLKTLHAVRNWRKKSRFAICWLQEIWAHNLPHLNGLRDELNRFDHVICPLYQTLEPLREWLDVPVTYLPAAVDTELFCPFPSPPARAIDITNIGGADPWTHEELIAYAERTGKYYSYDTIRGYAGMASHIAHRRNYAGMLKRSKYFLSYIAKVDRPGQRGAQEEFGPRYIEGAAAGAVLLGDRPQNAAFREYFGWEDAVIDAPYPSHGISDIIEALEADPARVAAIRRRNIIEALSRHDHLHRWRRVLEIAGLPPTPKLTLRQARLDRLIRHVEAADESLF